MQTSTWAPPTGSTGTCSNTNSCSASVMRSTTVVGCAELPLAEVPLASGPARRCRGRSLPAMCVQGKDKGSWTDGEVHGSQNTATHRLKFKRRSLTAKPARGSAWQRGCAARRQAPSCHACCRINSRWHGDGGNELIGRICRKKEASQGMLHKVLSLAASRLDGISGVACPDGLRSVRSLLEVHMNQGHKVHSKVRPASQLKSRVAETVLCMQ